MITNPGGQIPPDEVIGRDALIRQLWRILGRQSLVLSAERRMGKTCIVKKMVAESPQDKLCIYRDLEGIRTPLEFVQTVFDDVENYLGPMNRTAKRVRGFLTQLSGAEVGGIIKIPDIAASHWKTLLTRTIEDLVEHQDQIVILFWDEMPLMLYNIKKRASEDVAMEVLDTLRSLRQNHAKVRMIFTGSIGLHNVISSLKQSGYANDPTNDMDTIDVPPLSSVDAEKLACLLLEGEDIETDDLQAVTRTIAETVDGMPYFIHHVVDEMVVRGGVVNVDTVSEIVDTHLTEANDRWHLRYYRERIDIYYEETERPFALNLLDVLSVADEPLVFDELFNLLKSRMETEDSETTRNVLALLQRDHYVVQQTDGKFQFRFPIIQRWWRIHRGLIVSETFQSIAKQKLATTASILEEKITTGDFDVYLCYNSSDKTEVKVIAEQLKERGILPWLDVWELQPGSPWQRALEKQIPQIKSVAVFVGSNGMGPWEDLEVRSFLREFARREVGIIPVILESTLKVPDLPIFLEDVSWVDFRETDPDPLEHLIWGITQKKGDLL